MAHGPERRVQLTLPWSTLLKVLATAALVWALLQLIQIVLVLSVAVLLAVALDPVVAWFQRRNLPRGVAVGVVSLAIIVLAGGFLWFAWSSLAEQSQFVLQQLSSAEERVSGSLPQWVHDALGQTNTDVPSALGSYGLRIAQSAMTAMTLIVFGFVLMIYFLTDGRRTYEWLIAFVPRAHRIKAHRTAAECRQVIFAYVAGNAITSVIAAVCTLAALWVRSAGGTAPCAPRRRIGLRAGDWLYRIGDPGCAPGTDRVHQHRDLRDGVLRPVQHGRKLPDYAMGLWQPIETVRHGRHSPHLPSAPSWRV